MALSVKFHLSFIDLDTVTPTQEALDSLSLDIVQRLKVLPIENDGKRVDLTKWKKVIGHFRAIINIEALLGESAAMFSLTHWLISLTKTPS